MPAKAEETGTCPISENLEDMEELLLKAVEFSPDAKIIATSGGKW